ncbi:MAG: leucine-rich repeat domain-containing protein, partial [Chloroflexota bacterium]
GNLSSVQRLYLDDNQLTSIPPELGRLSSIQTLDLNDNQLTSIPPEIGNLSSIQTLYLNDNQLTSIPSEIGNLSNLQTLYLDGNQLTSIPSEIGNLSSIETLNSNNNQLTSIPPEIGNLSNLTALWLSSNQLTQLPKEIGQLSELYSFFLSDNQLTDLPEEIGQLSEVHRILLNNNQLRKLPAGIGHLTKIEELNLSHNQLSTLPPEIGNLSEVWRLDLSYNQLSTFPPEIGNLPNLSSLTLSHNGLETLPEGIFYLTGLFTLDLSYNELSTLPSEITTFENLTSLNVAQNRLTTLPTEIANLSQLSSLNLTSNQLTTLPLGIVNLMWLKHIRVFYNRLNISAPNLWAFLDERANRWPYDWHETQTIAPSELTATPLSDTTVRLSWTPIAFQSERGFYEISIATDGTFAVYGQTTDKASSTHVLTGLSPGVTYAIRIRTYTAAHDGSIHYNDSEQPTPLWSPASEVVSVTMPIYPDDYEDDNQCDQATTIQPDGPTQSHNFHVAADQDWMAFTPSSLGHYRIEGTSSPDFPVDLEFFYYTNCNDQPRSEFIETFTPHARLDVVVEQIGLPVYIQAKQANPLQAGASMPYTLSVRSITDTTMLDDRWPPYIAHTHVDIRPNDVQGHFHAEVRHPEYNRAIEQVWAEIYLDSSDGISNIVSHSTTPIDIIQLTPETLKLTAPYVGAYDAFTEKAIYRVVIHAQDTSGLLAHPTTLRVDARTHVFLPTIHR